MLDQAEHDANNEAVEGKGADCARLADKLGTQPLRETSQ
jgi:hypothetical protein